MQGYAKRIMACLRQNVMQMYNNETILDYVLLAFDVQKHLKLDQQRSRPCLDRDHGRNEVSSMESLPFRNIGIYRPHLFII